MSNSRFCGVIAVAVVLWLFHSDQEKSIRLTGIGTTSLAVEQGAEGDDAQYVFTASQDGRKIFMWKRQGADPPKFVGESDAVLNE